MFRMSETVTIDRPATDVFDFVADLHNFPLWRANLASSTVVSERRPGSGPGARRRSGSARDGSRPRARSRPCHPVGD